MKKVRKKDCLEEYIECINVKQYYELAPDTEDYFILGAGEEFIKM